MYPEPTHPMAAPKGNQYAAKSDDDKAGDSFSLRAPAGLKGRAVQASRKDNQKLTPWIIEAIDDKASGRIPPYYTQAPVYIEVTAQMKELDNCYLDVFGQKGIYGHHRITLTHPAHEGIADESKGALMLTTSFRPQYADGPGPIVSTDLYLHPNLIGSVRPKGAGSPILHMRLDYPHA